MQDFNSLVQKQRQFFLTGATLPLDFRLEQLKKLQTLFYDHEKYILEALQSDLKKAALEAYVSEFALVMKEIKFAMKKLHKWMKVRKARSPFPIFWPGQSRIHYEPYGVALIIAPWNYPFYLTMSPLIGAISAGNCVILKPSEMAPQTEDFIFKLLNHHYPHEYISVCKSNAEETKQLLQEKFDYIFFTGSTSVGKEVMTAAAKHLTPVTLELGGKTPCIVDSSANIDFAARRIMWGKFLNTGQTCIAPDHLFIQEDCKDIFIKKCLEILNQFYGDDPKTSKSYGRIINKKHFYRITNLMKQGNILVGGQTSEDELYISPTLIDGITWNDPIMQQEIFGPILPILTFKNFQEVIDQIKSQPKPLALYLFSHTKEHEADLLTHVSFGNGCINECVLQIANYQLPFGGIGESGMGNYHGKFSFETFSHAKSVYKRLLPLDFKLEYPPFNDKHMRWVKQIFKF